MGRRQLDSQPILYVSLILISFGLISCIVVYTFLSLTIIPGKTIPVFDSDSKIFAENRYAESGLGDESGDCCRGVDKYELWGAVVEWGTHLKFNSAEECCKACKAMCNENDGSCLCDSWVFCSNRETCGKKFGECWLKKQKDILDPEVEGGTISWTSGLIFGKGEGIIGLETEHGTLRVKLFSNCAPHSVKFILELLELRHCVGCQFYRSESRGQYWDSEGNHIRDASFGPPFALVQGTLKAIGSTSQKIPREVCPTIRRGSIAWVGSGPEFFISLANHEEWQRKYTVFGSVLQEDMEIAEKIAQLPTRLETWNNITVSVLENPVPFLPHRIKRSS